MGGWGLAIGALGVLIYGLSVDDEPDEEGSMGWGDDFALMIMRKFITRTQMAQLLEYSPLVVRGRPLLGGIPTRTKDPGSFIQTWIDGKLKWIREGDAARPIEEIEEAMRNNPDNYPDYVREIHANPSGD